MTNTSPIVVPTIDFSESRFGVAADRRQFADEIDAAFSGAGFFYAQSHGVPQAVIDAAFAAAAAFYGLPDAAKAEVAANAVYRGYADLRRNPGIGGEVQPNGLGVERTVGREMFNLSLDLDIPPGPFGLYGQNNWPRSAPDFKVHVSRYFDRVNRFSRRIMQGLALAVGMDEAFFADRFAGRHLNQCTLHHYLPLAAADLDAGAASCVSHTDISFITCLYQDAVGGLQVRPRGSPDWIDVPPVAGTFVINAGDLLALWTNGRYEATPHRVINSSGKERYSISVGCYPRADVLVDPRQLGFETCADGYQPVVVGEHLRRVYTGVYATQ
jgi:isopenicillin N synthase-like dioxygenase